MGIMFSPSWRGDTIELELKTKVYDMAYKIRVSRTLKNSARARWPAFKFQLGHLLVVCLWTYVCWTSDLNLFLCKMRLVTFVYWVVVKMYWIQDERSTWQSAWCIVVL